MRKTATDFSPVKHPACKRVWFWIVISVAVAAVSVAVVLFACS